MIGTTDTGTEVAPPSPRQLIEAFLFVGGPALTIERVAEVVRGMAEAQFRDILAELDLAYRRQGRPYGIQAREGGFVLALRPRYRMVVERLHGAPREARLSQPSIDVLSLVAYRQPIGRGEIDSVRGSDSASLLRQLVRHGLIALVPRGEDKDREPTYATTARFLELFHLRSLEDLPQTQDLQRL